MLQIYSFIISELFVNIAKSTCLIMIIFATLPCAHYPNITYTLFKEFTVAKEYKNMKARATHLFPTDAPGELKHL